MKVRNILQKNNNTPIKKTNVLPVKSKSIKDNFSKNNILHNVKNVVKNEVLEIDKKCSFFDSFKDVCTLHRAGTIVDVAGKGNCGYLVLKLGLKDVQKHSLLLSNSVHDLRIQMYTYAKKEFHSLSKKLLYNVCIPTSSIEKQKKYWENNILAQIYTESTNFENEAGREYWWDTLNTSGIACDLFKINLVTYSLPNPKTFAFHYGKEEIQYKQVDGKNDLDVLNYFPKNKQPTVYMINVDGCHYKFFKRNIN